VLVFTKTCLSDFTKADYGSNLTHESTRGNSHMHSTDVPCLDNSATSWQLDGIVVHSSSPLITPTLNPDDDRSGMLLTCYFAATYSSYLYSGLE